MPSAPGAHRIIRAHTASDRHVHASISRPLASHFTKLIDPSGHMFTCRRSTREQQRLFIQTVSPLLRHVYSRPGSSHPKLIGRSKAVRFIYNTLYAGSAGASRAGAAVCILSDGAACRGVSGAILEGRALGCIRRTALGELNLPTCGINAVSLHLQVITQYPILYICIHRHMLIIE